MQGHRYFLALLTLTLLTSFGAPRAFAQADAGQKVPDGMVRFETGSSRITAESELALDRIGAYIAGQAAGNILIVGHTDRHGAEKTNLRLSKSRARTIKRALIRRKVPGHRITVMGVGFSEPLSRDKTKQADDLNRRVEVWVGTREAIAWISYIYRTVQTLKPATQDWSPAEIRMPLRRLFRVRTLDRSAGEVSFGEGGTIFLGPKASVAIYGKDEDRAPKTRAVADITVEQGGILASLGGTPVLADTKDARFAMRSKRVRIDANEDKGRSTVSVYDGETEVTAQNKTVKVDEGYGTRVKRGQAPEPPSPLAPPPIWDGNDGVMGFEGQPTRLAWTPSIATDGAIVEVATVDDPGMNRPIETRVVEGRNLTFTQLPPGVYWVQVTSTDDRDIIGLPSTSKKLIILPKPESAGPDSMVWSEDRWLLDKPGPVRLPGARGARTRWQDELGRPLPDVIEVGPGTRRLTATLVDARGNTVGEGEVIVQVRPVSVELVEVERTAPAGDKDEITFVVEAKDGQGRPVDGLKLLAGPIDGGVLEKDLEDPTWLVPLSASRTGTGTPSLGEGRYRLTWLTEKSRGSSARYALVYDPTKSIGQHVLLPVIGPLTAPPPQPGDERPQFVQGLHIGLTGGVERARGAFHPAFRAELGWTVVANDLVRLSLGVESGYTRASVPAGTVEKFPIFGRATVGLLAGPMRPYVGVGGGVRFLNASLDDPNAGPADLEAPKAAIEGILGLGAVFRSFEVFVEGRYGPTRASADPALGTVGEPGLYGGLRYYLSGG